MPLWYTKEMKKTIITIVSLIVLLTLVLYGYEFIFKKPVITSPTVEVVDEVPTQALDIKEEYKNSKYTFAGTLPVPTPCHSISSRVNTITKDRYQIEITTTPPKEGVMCAQVITDKKFKVAFEAPAEINVTALIDGVPYELNRFVIPEGENIDTFELFIKG